jgi:GTP-binding protein Era
MPKRRPPTQPSDDVAPPTDSEVESEPEAAGDVASPDSVADDMMRRAGFVALVGRPNVGKSTLLNRMVGEKVAITSPRPQTTRRRILGIRTTPEAQAVFVDTPGIHKPTSPLGEYMVKEARAAMPDADVVVWVVDIAHLPTDDDVRIAVAVRQAARPTLIAMNKSDLLKPQDIQSHTETFADLVRAADWMLTIARDGYNLDALWALIVERLPIGPALFPEDQLTDQTDRAFAAELIREAALRYLQQEVPHGVDVVIEDWVTQPNGVLHIAAKVIVERTAHKPIVIGAGGAMLKQIGSSARRELERVLECRVYLELFVAVREGWLRHPDDVRRMGYH